MEISRARPAATSFPDRSAMKGVRKSVLSALAVAVLLLSQQAAAAHKRALAAVDIEAKDVPPARLRATFRIYYAAGKFEDGQLLRIWTPFGWWHDEQKMPGFESVEVSNGKQIWTAGSLPYVPFPIFLIRRALGLPRALRAASARLLTEPSPSADGAYECARSEDDNERFEYCFEAQTGNLVRLFDSRWNVNYEYSDYQAFGAKRFPRTIRILRTSGKRFVEIHVAQLVPEKNPDLRIFLPVKGSRETATARQCPDIEQAKLTKKVSPVFPKAAQSAGITGMVRLYSDVGVDGIPRGLWPINSVPPVLARAAIEAVREWRYRPRTCRTTGKPMPASVLVTVLFVSR
jgi:hypothetical protein